MRLVKQAASRGAINGNLMKPAAASLPSCVKRKEHAEFGFTR
jgi:hypothetical protein